MNATVNRQRGLATLTIAILILIIASVAGLLLSRGTVSIIRTGNNTVSQMTAQAEAEGRLTQALVTWFKPFVGSVADWSVFPLCSETALANFFDNTENWRCRTVQAGDPAEALPVATRVIDDTRIFVLLAEGGDPNRYAETRVRAKLAISRTGSEGEQYLPPPPIAASGSIGIGGNMRIVANPNGGCPADNVNCGVPVSVWSGSSVGGNGAPETCQLGDYDFGANNPQCLQQLSPSGMTGPDIVQNDPNFPADLLDYLFGVPTDQYEALKLDAYRTEVMTDCGQLSAKAGQNYTDINGDPRVPIFWVTGNCDLQATTIGSTDKPAIVIVEGQITLNSNSTFNGLLFNFAPNRQPGGIRANGGGTINGSLISNHASNPFLNANGTFNAIYNPTILNKLGGTILSVRRSQIAVLPANTVDFWR